MREIRRARESSWEGELIGFSEAGARHDQTLRHGAVGVWRPHSFAVAGMTGLPYAIRPDVFSGCAERVSDF